jgi:hypothetical protein
VRFVRWTTQSDFAEKRKSTGGWREKCRSTNIETRFSRLHGNGMRWLTRRKSDRVSVPSLRRQRATTRRRRGSTSVGHLETNFQKPSYDSPRSRDAPQPPLSSVSGQGGPRLASPHPARGLILSRCSAYRGTRRLKARYVALAAAHPRSDRQRVHQNEEHGADDQGYRRTVTQHGSDPARKPHRGFPANCVGCLGEFLLT